MSTARETKAIREAVLAELQRRGFKDGELQSLWRSSACFTRPYDQTEVGYAICDALTREGCTAWWGDGTSCVEQMIRLQWDRAVTAEKERDEHAADILTLRRVFTDARKRDEKEVARLYAENAELRETLAFVTAKLRIVLSSHICADHGAGLCGDRDGAEEAIRRSEAVNKSNFSDDAGSGA